MKQNLTSLPRLLFFRRIALNSLLLLLGFASTLQSRAADPFAAGVRETEPLAPSEQLKKFHLPPGFEIQLVAAEPDLRKPMNMAFDALGRLWLTESREYPFAAPVGKPARDTIRIFSDFDDSGRARKVTVFADGLNIPIGIYPFYSPASGGKDGFTWKCIAWSIPNIWLMEDTDGDGKADKREVLYGPFDHTRDTHGNQASFRRGFDGWLYATHGFNNDSHVKGRDGHQVDLNSGNTYRMRLDGSRIEHHTWGQVNPFGLAWDPAGNLYSSDCHSAPTYQLLAGGYYPSFGKPHDGLGFAPVLMEHSHGSTAIDGMLYYADNLWPEEFANNIFIGNVMTSRINRDRLEFNGSSPKAIELPDLVTTDDPWFRPVDNQLGPDGAFYIADFYNRIIGHYEVPLQHPGRDRERGRLWRVVYRGKDGQLKMHQRKVDLTKATAEELIRELADPNLTWRMLAMSQITDRVGKSATSGLQRAVNNPLNSFHHIHALWLLHRLNPPNGESGPTPSALEAAARSGDRLVRVHAERLAADILYQDLVPGIPKNTEFIQAAHAVASNGLKDSDALVRRCAAEAMGNYRSLETVRQLLDLVPRVPPADTHLLYVARKALRDQLTTDTLFQNVLNSQWSDADIRGLADVAIAVKSPLAGTFLLRHLSRLNQDRASLSTALQQAARYAPVADLEKVVTFVREKFAGDSDFQVALFASVEQGVGKSGAKLSEALLAWGTELCSGVLGGTTDSAWWNTPLEGVNDPRNPWAFQERRCADGQTSRLLSSHPLGEHLTGTLRSRPFALPAKLSFYLAGHQGEPTRPPHQRNVIRLRSAESGEVLAESFPSRNDIAQKITWEIAAVAGKQGYIEVTDGDAADAWAWLAFGRFDPPVLRLPSVAPGDIARRQQTAAELAGRLRLPVQVQVQQMALSSQFDSDARAAAARTLAILNRDAAAKMLPSILTNSSHPMRLREGVGVALIEADLPQGRSEVLVAMKSAPHRVQLKWAQTLAASATGAEALLQGVADGNAAPSLLQDRTVKDRLLAAKPADVAARIEKLTKGLPPADLQRERLIAQRSRGFATASPRFDDGKRLFQQHCAVCHRIGGEGALVGPQLDGIGNRGLERLVEDVLDPNRNVDRAFRSHIIGLKDGDVVSGLPRREEGEVLILADSTGKEISVPKKNIGSRRESETSLMPENFGDLLSPDDFNHLLAFLLSKGSAPTKQP